MFFFYVKFYGCFIADACWDEYSLLIGIQDKVISGIISLDLCYLYNVLPLQARIIQEAGAKGCIVIGECD